MKQPHPRGDAPPEVLQADLIPIDAVNALGQQLATERGKPVMLALIRPLT